MKQALLIALIPLITSVGWAKTIVLAVQEDLDKMPPIIEVKDYIRDALAPVGIEVQYVAASFDRSTFMVDSGDIDGEILRNKAIAKSAPNLKPLSFPLAYSKFRVVRRKDIPSFNESNLKNYNGAVFYTSNYIRQTLEVRNLRLAEVAKMDQVFLMLMTGRTDYTILPDVIIAVLKDTKPEIFKNLIISDRIFIQDELYILMNKRNAILIPKIEKALKAASKNSWKKYHYLPELIYKNAN